MNMNTLCTNEIHVIYFCPNCVNFLPENVQFLIFGGGDRPPCLPARAPMHVSSISK